MTVRTVDIPDGSEHRPDSIGVFFVICKRNVIDLLFSWRGRFTSGRQKTTKCVQSSYLLLQLSYLLSAL